MHLIDSIKFTYLDGTEVLGSYDKESGILTIGEDSYTFDENGIASINLSKDNLYEVLVEGQGILAHSDKCKILEVYGYMDSPMTTENDFVATTINYANSFKDTAYVRKDKSVAMVSKMYFDTVVKSSYYSSVRNRNYFADPIEHARLGWRGHSFSDHYYGPSEFINDDVELEVGIGSIGTYWIDFRQMINAGDNLPMHKDSLANTGNGIWTVYGDWKRNLYVRTSSGGGKGAESSDGFGQHKDGTGFEKLRPIDSRYGGPYVGQEHQKMEDVYTESLNTAFNLDLIVNVDNKTFDPYYFLISKRIVPYISSVDIYRKDGNISNINVSDFVVNSEDGESVRINLVNSMDSAFFSAVLGDYYKEFRDKISNPVEKIVIHMSGNNTGFDENGKPLNSDLGTWYDATDLDSQGMFKLTGRFTEEGANTIDVYSKVTIGTSDRAVDRTEDGTDLERSSFSWKNYYYNMTNPDGPSYSNILRAEIRNDYEAGHLHSRAYSNVKLFEDNAVKVSKGVHSSVTNNKDEDVKFGDLKQYSVDFMRPSTTSPWGDTSDVYELTKLSKDAHTENPFSFEKEYPYIDEIVFTDTLPKIKPDATYNYFGFLPRQIKIYKAFYPYFNQDKYVEFTTTKYEKNYVPVYVPEYEVNYEIEYEPLRKEKTQPVMVPAYTDEYEYDPVYEYMQKVNSNGEPVFEADGTTPVYELDEDGNKIPLVDDEGNYVIAKDNSGNDIYEIRRDSNGNPVYKVKTDANGNTVYEELLDDEGNVVTEVVTEEITDEDGNTISRPVYEDVLDENGDVVMVPKTDSTGKIVYKTDSMVMVTRLLLLKKMVQLIMFLTIMERS